MTDINHHILAGQRALVTGATSGIGRAIAVVMGATGAAVAVNYRADRDAAARVVSEIADAGGQACAVQADVTREEAVDAMFAAVVERFGTIDIPVNNAGIQKDAPFHAMSLDDWRAVIDVNLTGQYLCARAAVREFCAAASSHKSPRRPARSSSSVRFMRSFLGPAVSITRPPRVASR